MEHLHSDLNLKADDVIIVDLEGGGANVMRLDPINYEAYQKGPQFRYHGGHAKTTQIRLAVPHDGRWRLVVDLGGYPGKVKAGIRVLSASMNRA